MWHRSSLAVCCALAGLAGSARAQNRPAIPDELEQVRAALEKYQDPVVAIHDSYFSTLGCVEIPKPGGEGQVPYKPGGMGVHFLNLSFLSPVPDPAKPQVLLYEPALP